MTEGKQLTLRDAVRELENQYDGIRNQFDNALPPHIKPDKFKSVVVTAVNLNPDLLRADRRSLFNECLKAAADGLVPDGREGFLNTYAGKVAWQPMIFGIIKRIRQSGDIASVGARIIYENEMMPDGEGKPRFQFIIDDAGERIEHSPIIFGERGKMIGVYAYATFKDGTREFEPLNLQDIEKIRLKSKSPNKGPWVDWYEEMAKKSAIRRLSKRLPLSADIMATIHREDPRAEIDDIRDRRQHDALAQLGAPELEPEEAMHANAIEEPGTNGVEEYADVGDWEKTVARATEEMATGVMKIGDLREFADHMKSIIAGAPISEDDRKRLLGEFNAAYLGEIKKLS